ATLTWATDTCRQTGTSSRARSDQRPEKTLCRFSSWDRTPAFRECPPMRSDHKCRINILVRRNRAYYGSTTDAVYMFVEQIEQDRNGHARKQKRSNLSGH